MIIHSDTMYVHVYMIIVNYATSWLAYTCLFKLYKNILQQTLFKVMTHIHSYLMMFILAHIDYFTRCCPLKLMYLTNMATFKSKRVIILRHNQKTFELSIEIPKREPLKTLQLINVYIYLFKHLTFAYSSHTILNKRLFIVSACYG